MSHPITLTTITNAHLDAGAIAVRMVDCVRCPGHSVLLLDDRCAALATALAERAELRSSHPWVESVDDELAAIMRQDPPVTIGEGGIRFADERHGGDLTGQVGHYAISYHLGSSAVVLRPEQTRALLGALARDDAQAYLDEEVEIYDPIAWGGPQVARVRRIEAIVYEHSCVPATETRLDTELFDEDVERYYSVPVAGPRFVDTI